jgi:hypothetical protein
MEGLADIATDQLPDIDEDRSDEEDDPGLRFNGPDIAQFSNSQLPILLAQRRDVRGTEIARILGAQWRRMSADEKADWTPPPTPPLIRSHAAGALNGALRRLAAASPFGLPRSVRLE